MLHEFTNGFRRRAVRRVEFLHDISVWVHRGETIHFRRGFRVAPKLGLSRPALVLGILIKKPAAKRSRRIQLVPENRRVRFAGFNPSRSPIQIIQLFIQPADLANIAAKGKTVRKPPSAAGNRIPDLFPEIIILRLSRISGYPVPK